MSVLSRALDAVGDGLWGAEDQRAHPAPHALPVFLGVAVAIVVLLVLRRTDAITNPQFWAEDASVFFQQNLELGCWRALHTLFHGFPYLGQRLVACAATPSPLREVPLIYNVVSYVVVAVSLASFSTPSFRHVIRSDALRVAFCLAIPALPQAWELVGNLTNTSWFLGIWLMLLTLMRLPRASVTLAFLGLAGLVATFSTPLSILTAPLWLMRALHALPRRRWREVGFASLAFCGVLLVISVTGDLGRDRSATPSVTRALRDTLSIHVLAQAALGPRAVLGVEAHLGRSGMYAIAIALLTALAVLAWRTRRRSLPVLLYCAYGILLSSAMALIGRPRLALAAAKAPTALKGLSSIPVRYHLLAVGLVYLAALASIDRLPRGRSHAIALAMLFTLIGSSVASTLVVSPFHDLQWPSYAARLERKRAEGSPDPLSIPVNPDPSGFWFAIQVDERAVRPKVDVPPDRVVGSANDTTLEQSFTARCPNLSEIDLLFGKEGHAATQTAQVQLREEPGGRVVATFSRDAAHITGAVGPEAEASVSTIEQQLRTAGVASTRQLARRFAGVDNPVPLYFAPIPDSEGRRYVISVTASGGGPGNSVNLLGSATDAYPDGQASLNGTPIPGDLAFQYACSRQ